MLLFRKAIGIRRKRKINRLFRNIRPVGGLLFVGPWLRIYKGSHIPGFFRAKDRFFVRGLVKRHIVHCIRGKIGKAEEARSIGITVFALERWCGVFQPVQRHLPFPVRSMAGLALVIIHQPPFYRVGSTVQVRKFF